MKSWNRVCHVGVSWAKQHRGLLAMAVALAQACALPSCAGTAGPAASREQPGGKVSDIGPRPVEGLDVFRAKLVTPKEFIEKAKPNGSYKTLFHIMVGADGRIQKVDSLISADPVLVAAVVRVVKETAWLPAIRGGRPVESEIRLPVTFRVRDSLMMSYSERHAFHRDYDQPPRPVDGMDALKARLVMPGKFYRAAGPDGSGKVSVEVWVREDGVMQRVKLKNSNDVELDAALVEALRGVQWLPAKKKGKPVGSIFGLPVTFRTKGR